jgi:hypothetical protein
MMDLVVPVRRDKRVVFIVLMIFDYGLSRRTELQVNPLRLEVNVSGDSITSRYAETHGAFTLSEL